MSNRMLHVRIPPQLDAQLRAFCEAYAQTQSTVVRGALAYALARPGLYVELCGHPVPTVFEELRSPEQIAAYAAYEQEMQAFDLNTIVRENGLA